MKNYLALAVASLTFSTLALGATAGPASADREMLLTPNGTLYTIESEFTDAHPEVRTSSTRFLVLTTQRGDVSTSIPIPESLRGGSNASPALTYDAETETLFVFWEKSPTRMSSDLLFCSYQNGRWSAATSIESADFHARRNLKVGTTRHTEVIGADGKRADLGQLTIHAVWWDESGYGETARYAMLAIDNGNVASVQVRDLSSFEEGVRFQPISIGSVTEDTRQLLSQPALFESSGQDTIDILYGDLLQGSFHRVTLKPVSQGGRLRVPVGVRGQQYGAPEVAGLANMKISALPGTGENVAFYFVTNSRLNYLLRRGGKWSMLNSIAVNDKITSDAAINALRKMISAE